MFLLKLYLVVFPERSSVRHREERDVCLSTITIHGILNVDANSTGALVKNSELRLMIE